jgi:D-threo-aldose 1-dehydrogenase
MRAIQLGNTTIRTSLLGFGCVKLTTQEDRAAAVRTLEEALELGITHYDVARLYGYGQAEGILGEFLRGKRDQVTVTTKFGLRHAGNLSKHRWLITLAKKVLRKIPAVERRLKQRMAGHPPATNYTPQEAESSLDVSLRELGTDYVDLLLMHEATPQEASNPELLAQLDKEVKRGRIRAYGVGSEAVKFGDSFKTLPPGCQVAQFDSNILSPNIQKIRNDAGIGIITYYAMSPLKPLLELAQRAPDKMRAISEKSQLDLSNPQTLGGLLIDDATRTNPNGVTLVSSVSGKHLKTNVNAAQGNLHTDAHRQALAELCALLVP